MAGAPLEGPGKGRGKAVVIWSACPSPALPRSRYATLVMALTTFPVGPRELGISYGSFENNSLRRAIFLFETQTHRQEPTDRHREIVTLWYDDIRAFPVCRS